MPGPRRDKQVAWDSLSTLLEGYMHQQGRLKPNSGQEERRKCAEEVRHSLRVLQASGRIDAKQVFFIKQLIKRVWDLAVPEILF